MNDEVPMTNDAPTNESGKPFNLEERTAMFGDKEEARVLWQEAKELNLIFGAILRSGQ